MKNPEISGTYLCRLENGFICIVFFDKTKDSWVEMWGTKKVNVIKYIDIPEELYDRVGISV